MNSKSQVPSARALISAAASMAATAMLVRSVTRDLIPNELRNYITTKFHQFLTTFSNEVTLVIDEFDGLNKNQLYYAAELYISTIVSSSTKKFRASLPKNEKKIHVSLGGLEEITDNFCGFQLKWKVEIKQTKPRYVPNQDGYHSSTMVSEVRFLQLTFHKKHKDRVIDEYLSYVLERSKSVREEKKTLKLCTLKNDRIHGPSTNPWQSVNLDHPANFDTLAMDDEIKNMIIEDLDRFVKRKEFYRKVGKAWKRGYLLFGPPGTGKSSLIAAMANYLKFDVYDLELTDIRCNSDLRKLLISTANRSILVVEDIDASIDLSERKKKAVSKSSMGMYPYQPDQIPKVTLSGLLNFIDGLWSSCGDERIIIFTTNHKEKLDPALLRPGRMDVHIQMSYCTPFGFKLLARNYLGTTEHPLLLEAEQLVALSQVTPAEIGEQLLKSDDPETVLCGLVKFLELKRQVENETEKVALKLKGVEEGLGELRSGDSSSGGGLRESTKIGNSEGYKVEMKVSNNDEALNGFFEEGSGSGKTKASDAVLGSSVVTVGESGEGSES